MVKLESESESSLRTSGRLQSRREHGVGQDWSFLRGKSRKGKELPQVKEEFKVDDIKEEAKSTDNKATVKQSANMIPKKGSPSSQSRMKEEETPSLPRAAVKQETSSTPPDPAQSAIVVKTLEEAMKVEPSQRCPRSKRNDTTTGGPAQGSSQGVKVKREASSDVLPPMGVDHPTPAGTKESPAPQQLTPDEKEAREQLWRSKISKKVKSENLRFDLNVLWSRLVTAGIPPDLFPITLDREIRDVCVSRVFMSKMWGGSSQEAFPHIGKEFYARADRLMYPGPDSQPGAPEGPGAPGLWLDLEDETGTHWIASGGERLSACSRALCKQPCLWQYQGQYRVRIAERNMTAEEWRQQKATVRKAWAKNMSKDKMYEGLREYLVAKRFLGKEPDDYEIQQLRAGSMSTAMSEEEIQLCMTRGDLVSPRL
ncbi:hypothetical protein BKA70DRAFT_1339783 [Coprinopsis sp. MPI-PUGE-AT-0042]|nr:hypothetical protein BKA70DRAFT_1339783 [Coprinopsis sp. MPI-PUGE-AT-0042]